MLKVYTVKSYVSINGGDWQRVDHSGHIMTDNNPTEKVILNNATFDECYKYVYKEWKDVPLNYIMEHFSADKCIQYLKERGMSACPILK